MFSFRDMVIDMNKELIIKYFNNQCSDSEAKLVSDWIDKNADTRIGKEYLGYAWANMDEVEIKGIDFNNLLENIHLKINKNDDS